VATVSSFSFQRASSGSSIAGQSESDSAPAGLRAVIRETVIQSAEIKYASEFPLRRTKGSISRAFQAAATAVGSAHLSSAARSQLTSSVTDDSSSEEASPLDFVREKRCVVSGEKSRMGTLDGLSAYEIEQVKAGDVLAFEALYSKYRRTVYGLCLRSIKDVGDAEDLTQEVFLQVYRRVCTLRDGAAFKSWLFRVTTNIILMHSRRRRIVPISLQYILECATSAVSDIVQALTSPAREPIERITLVRAIGGLPKCRRTVLVMHDIKGMSHREIAASLGVSINTSKSNLSRAHRQLRGSLRGKSTATTLAAISRDLTQKPNDETLGETVGLQMNVENYADPCHTQSAVA
jgi:RNA polymerase sigma-70 factor (ECF subfamily)